MFYSSLSSVFPLCSAHLLAKPSPQESGNHKNGPLMLPVTLLVVEFCPMQDSSSSDPTLCSVLHRLSIAVPIFYIVCMRGLTSVTSCNMKGELLTEYKKAAGVFH